MVQQRPKFSIACWPLFQSTMTPGHLWAETETADEHNMASAATHYALLGLARTCSTDEVRAAYKARAMQSHPDRGGDPAVWQKVQLAFDTLADPEKRAVDRSEQDQEGGAETRLVQQFGAGAFDLSAGGASRAHTRVA